MRDLLRDEFFIKLVNDPDEDTQHFWQNWLEKYPERKEEFELARQTIRSIKYKNANNLSESDYNRMFLNIRAFKQREDEKESNDIPVTRKKWHPGLVRVAAIILFLMTVSISIIYLNSEFITDEMPLHEELVVINVPYGAKRTIRLADGSIIRLNAGSHLVFPKHFNDDMRNVELKGEAYFEVARDENRPFIIKTGDINTRVLGTSFNLRHYEHEDVTEVALVSGEVKVTDVSGKELFLQPLDAAVYSRNSKTIVKQNFDVRLVTGWKDNILVFDKATMSEIVERLESWYGVEIVLDLNKPLNGLYKGEYKDESLETVLDGIGFVHEFQYNMNGKNIIIKN